MGAIVLDAGAEVAANRAGRGLGGIGGAHGFAPAGDGALGFQGDHDDFAGAHEGGEFGEKAAFSMHGVEAFGSFARETERFDGADGETGFVNAREDYAGESAAEGIRLDDR